MKFTGIAASPGVGVGPVFRLVPEELAVREVVLPRDQVKPEIARFEAAREASRRDLTSIRDGIARELGEREAAIYEAHLLILDDPELKRSVEEAIRRDHRSAAWVFRNYMAGVAARLENLENEFLRERHADVLDVERRVLRYLLDAGARHLAGLDTPSVVVAHDLAPSDVAVLDRERVLAMVTEVGGRTSHGAIVARGRGIPAVVSARGVLQQVKPGDVIAVDGFEGRVEVNPDEATLALYRSRWELLRHESRALQEFQRLPAVSLDGRQIELGANIELPGEVEHVLAAGADGIGLFRTEFFYLNRVDLPGEEEQYRAYREVAERLAPRPVIFRTMDLGGDKVASYLGATHETNPFLGYRGIRLALSHPEMFRTQIRAIYRASAHGKVRMMYPMVSGHDELRRANELCAEVAAELRRGGVPHDPELEIGLMIETPSAVWMADVLARDARFFSIGTNDLTQYTLAMDRDNERLAHLYEPLDPAVLRSLEHVIEVGHAAKRWVGLCGEMAGDPATAVLLLGLGIDELSTSPFDLPRVKAAIRCVRYSDARALAREALARSSAAAVRELVRTGVNPLLPDYLVAGAAES